jgi:hypothetical protein
MRSLAFSSSLAALSTFLDVYVLKKLCEGFFTDISVFFLHGIILVVYDVTVVTLVFILFIFLLATGVV